MNNSISSNRLSCLRRAAPWLLLFAVLAVLCCCFPYSGDDWAWGSAEGRIRLENGFFDGYNGRYLGNLLVLALTRCRLLRGVAMSLCFCATLYFCCRFTGEKKQLPAFLLLFMLMPSIVFTQAVIWTSGFANYAPSAMFMLAYFCTVRDVFGNSPQKKSRLIAAAMLFTGFASALFVEHMTVFGVVISVFFIGFTFFVHKRVFAHQLTFFAGAAAGAAVMFSNSAYGIIAGGGDSVRTIVLTLDAIAERVKFNFGFDISRELITCNVEMNIILFLVFTALLFKKLKSKKLSASGRLAAYAALLANIVCVVAATMSDSRQNTTDEIQNLGLIFACETLYLLLFIPLTLILIDGREKKRRMLFELMCIPVVTAPLFFVRPIGGRCFFFTYLMFCCLAVEALGTFKLHEFRGFKIYTALVAAGACALLGKAFYCNLANTLAERDRVKSILEASAAGKKSVEIYELPFVEYAWTINPTSQRLWESYYRDFYSLDENIGLIYRERG